MKTFQEYIESRILAKDINNELLDANEDFRLLMLMDKYFEYCLSKLDATDETDKDKNLIVPLNTMLDQYAILCSYYDSMIKKKNSDILGPVKTTPNEADYPLKTSDVQASYDTLNKQITDNVKRVTAQFKFEMHSTGGRVVTNPKRAPHYLLASIVLIASAAGLITLAHQLNLISSFMPVFSITAISLVSALIAFTGIALFIRYGYEHYRTVPLADELTEKLDLTDMESPKRSFEHVYYAHDYYNAKNVSEALFQKKQLALHQLTNAAMHTPAPRDSSPTALLNKQITKNVLLTHYHRIYKVFSDYSKGKGLLETSMTGDYPHATNEPEKKLFRSTPFEPKVNITELKKENLSLKKSILNPSHHR